MAMAFIELEKILTSHKEKMTLEEADIIHKCNSKVIRDFDETFFVSTVLAGAATSTASRYLGMFAWFGLTMGSGFMFAMLRAMRSLESCADHILSLDGSRIQRELANIIVQKHHDVPWTMQLVYRHFYAEKVFDDAIPDKPTFRLRYRNFFSDNVAHDNQKPDNDTSGEHHGVTEIDPDTETTAVLFKQVFMNPGADETEDPLDVIFSQMAPLEEIHSPRTSSGSPRAPSRSHRRSQHRHRIHRHEVSLTRSKSSNMTFNLDGSTRWM